MTIELLEEAENDIINDHGWQESRRNADPNALAAVPRSEAPAAPM